MAHKMVYGVSSENYSDIGALKAMGFVDFPLVRHANAPPEQGFVNTCNSLHVTPMFNNGNDGISGCGGVPSCDNYYQSFENMGYQAVGGESEPPSESEAIKRHVTFLNYGGEYGDCGYNFSNIFAHGHAPSSGKGIISYLETYIGVSRVGLCPNELVEAVIAAKNAKCLEVGLLIGGWMTNHGYGSGHYIDMINRIEARGVIVNGVHWWWGFTTNANQYMSIAGNRQILEDLKARWPPDMRTLKERIAGGSTPTPDKPKADINTLMSVVFD